MRRFEGFFLNSLIGGMAVGFVVSLFIPLPKASENCKLYKVDTKHATAFVLSPPKLDAAACPAVQKCEAVAPVVAEQAPEVTPEPETPRRHHRRRWRRHWR